VLHGLLSVLLVNCAALTLPQNRCTALSFAADCEQATVALDMIECLTEHGAQLNTASGVWHVLCVRPSFGCRMLSSHSMGPALQLCTQLQHHSEAFINAAEHGNLAAVAYLVW
jgi:hypothetical protein